MLINVDTLFEKFSKTDNKISIEINGILLIFRKSIVEHPWYLHIQRIGMNLLDST